MSASTQPHLSLLSAPPTRPTGLLLLVAAAVLCLTAEPALGQSDDYWSGKQELHRCTPLRLKAHASFELCYESLPAEGGRRFQIAIRDASALGEDQYHHKLVTRIDVPVQTGEYMDFRRPSAFDLDTLQLIWAPVVHGTPSKYDRGHIMLYIFDPARRRLKPLSTRLECPAQCSMQFLSYQLARRPGVPGGKLTLIHQRRVDGQSLRSSYRLNLKGGKGVAEEIEKPRSEAAIARGKQAPPSTPVCQRTEQVRKEIERRLQYKSCKEITPEDLARISFLEISNRRIRRLKPGDFSGMPNLNRIELSSNPLQAIQRGLFAGLFKLRSLNFQKCQLSSVPPRVFEDLSSLKSLYLNHNRISRLHPDSFAGLDALTFLALNNNQIRALPEGVFAPLKSLKRPYLSNNPLRSR